MLQGASAILEFNTIESPLAQPRNAFLGNIFSAIIGVAITKLFRLSPHFESLRWVAGALSVGIASAFMGLTKTVHPPAGATALLCSTQPAITQIGWFVLPLVILGTALLLFVACILNNIQRRFPMYWWTSEDLSRPTNDSITSAPSGAEGAPDTIETGEMHDSETHVLAASEGRITVDKDSIIVPHWIVLGYEEIAILEILRTKIREGWRSPSQEQPTSSG